MLTVIEVNILGNLVPSAVVEVPDLFLVLHHACRLAFLLILQGNIILNSFKVFPMLKKQIFQAN